MALSAGAVVAKFKSDITDLKKGVAEAKSAVGGFKDSASKMGDELKTSFDGFMGAVKVATAVGVGAFALFAKSSMDLKSETDKANISLEIMATRFGHNAERAKELGKSLGKDLRIGTGSANEALQNLIKSGLTLDQSADLIKRFTNEAMTGKSESISLADAVKNLSFAYATNNSALGNMSGVSENWSDITAKGATVLENWNGKANESAGITEELAVQIRSYEESLKAQGKTLDAGNPEMAKYVGLMQLTNLTAGSSDKFLGTFTDNMAQMQYKVDEVKLALGALLQDALNPLVLWFTSSGILDNMQRFIAVLGNIGTYLLGIFQGQDLKAELTEAFSFFTGGDMQQAEVIAGYVLGFVEAMKQLGTWISENQELVKSFFTGLAVVVGGLIIFGTIAGLIGLLTNPLTLLIGALTLLFMAWQNNWLGIQTITSVAVEFIKAIFIGLQSWWAEWGTIIVGLITGIWQLIQGVFQVAGAIITGIMAVFIGLLTGNWQKAGDMLKASANLAWNGIVNIITGAFGVILNALHAFINNFTSKLDGLFDKAREIAGKIKGALEQISPFHKSSPSLVEYVQMGTGDIKDAYRNLAHSIGNMDFKANVMPMGGIAGAIGQNGGLASDTPVVNQYITQNVQDSADAQLVNERLAFMYRNAT